MVKPISLLWPALIVGMVQKSLKSSAAILGFQSQYSDIEARVDDVSFSPKADSDFNRVKVLITDP